MSPRLWLLVLILPMALAVACDRASSSSPSATPSSFAGVAPTSAGVADPAAVSTASAMKNALERFVNIEDACDPETFNAALGAGTCVRSGGVRFETFLDQLRRHGSIGSWHFAPSRMTLREGDRFVAVNRGGETHTFTEVDEFGGGIVPSLNEAIGATTVAPECQQLDPDDFIASGATFRDEDEEGGEEPGNVKYQCCIHPWMRLEARVMGKVSP